MDIEIVIARLLEKAQDLRFVQEVSFLPTWPEELLQLHEYVMIGIVTLNVEHIFELQ